LRSAPETRDGAAGAAASAAAGPGACSCWPALDPTSRQLAATAIVAIRSSLGVIIAFTRLVLKQGTARKRRLGGLPFNLV
jgi:hypothetical protein